MRLPKPFVTLSALLVIALASALGCSTAPRRAIQPLDLIGYDRPACRVSVHGPTLPASAATFAIANDSGSPLPAEAEALVTSLFERQGWRRVDSEREADAILRLGDGSADNGSKAVYWGSFPERTTDFGRDRQGTGDAIVPSAGRPPTTYVPAVARWGRYLHQMELELRVGGASEPTWGAVVWDHTNRPESSSATLRLVAALADRVPAPGVISAERTSVDRLGTDFLALGAESVVLEVAPRSLAERAGWQPGDRLLEIEGRSVAGLGWTEIASRLAAAERGAVEVELLRSGERYLTYLVPDPRRLAG